MGRWSLVVVGVVLLACSGVASPDVAPREDAEVEEPSDEPEGEPSDEPSDEPGDAPALLPDVPPDTDDRDEDCMPESYEDADRILAKKQTKGGKVQVDASPNRMVETVTLKNGLTVRITRAGCLHLYETWELAPAPKGPAPKVFRKVLARLDRASEDTLGIDDCLEAAPAKVSKKRWSVNDFVHCSVEREGDVLSLTFDYEL